MSLPVERIRDQLNEPFEKGALKRILLRAPTGSGKSTAVPSMLLDGGVEGMVVVIQPRRIAARMLANRVAQLRGVRLGDEVGYTVRFDSKRSERTRILFVTDGVFQHWLESDPLLKGVGYVLFDEFHERRVSGDVALAMVMEMQEGGRPDLGVMVMSATLEMGDLAAYLAPCRELQAEGRTYSVEIDYAPAQQVVQRGGRQQRVEVWDQCFNAAREAVEKEDCGHVLIFLPGVHEIRKTVSLLEGSSHFRGWNICPLYSALSPSLQDEAVAGSVGPKIIVSTNVAETSLTIDGVRTVIDAGTARVSSFDPNRGMETLLVKPISQAAAEQRAGRAGRTSEGRCVRLWSHTNHAKRAAFELPEICRADIAELMLKFKAAGREVDSFAWLDAPLPESIATARQTLEFLDAIDADGKITSLGEAMAKFSLPPRFSRFLFAGSEEGCLAEVCFIAAAIQGEGVFLRRKGEVGRSDFLYDTDGSDFAGEYRAFLSAKSMRFDSRRCGELGILARGAREVDQAFRQICQLAERVGLEVGEIDFEKAGEAVSFAALKAFGDRVGRRYNKHSLAARLADGRKGTLDGESVAKHSELFIPTEITEVGGKEVVTYFRRCVGLSAAMISQRFEQEVRVVESVNFDSTVRRVLSSRQLCYKGFVIDEKAGGEPDPELASALLAEKVASGELVLNKWDKNVETYIARLLGLREWMPELELPGFGEEDRALALEQVCQGALSYKEIKNREVLPAVRAWLSAAQQAALDAFAPEQVSLANGRKARVYYQEGKKPWIAMRAQHLFGVEQSPTIANGAMRLNVHICAPNNRPWQITDDLKNFWESGFEQMRKDLGGRYPKHQWTLDP